MRKYICIILISSCILLSFAGCATIGLDSTGGLPTDSPVTNTTQQKHTPTPTAPTTQPIPSTVVTVPPTTVPVPTTTVPVPSTAPQLAVIVNMELSPSLQQEISDLWFAVNGTDLYWEATNNLDEPSVQFHGSFNDKHILVTVEDAPVVTIAFSLDVGYCVLWKGSCPFQVYVCYEGTLITIKGAYDADLFTDDEVEVIFDYLCTVFPDEESRKHKNSHRANPVGVFRIAISCRTWRC